jgi:hypothetical protein
MIPLLLVLGCLLLLVILSYRPIRFVARVNPTGIEFSYDGLPSAGSQSNKNFKQEEKYQLHPEPQADRRWIESQGDQIKD